MDDVVGDFADSSWMALWPDSVYNTLMPSQIWINHALKEMLLMANALETPPDAGLPLLAEQTTRVVEIIGAQLNQACADATQQWWPSALTRTVVEYAALDSWTLQATFPELAELRMRLQLIAQRRNQARWIQPRLRPARELHAAYVKRASEELERLRAQGFVRAGVTNRSNAGGRADSDAKASVGGQSTDPDALEICAIKAVHSECKRGKRRVWLSYRCPFCVRGHHRRTDGCVARTAKGAARHGVPADSSGVGRIAAPNSDPRVEQNANASARVCGCRAVFRASTLFGEPSRFVGPFDYFPAWLYPSGMIITQARPPSCL